MTINIKNYKRPTRIFFAYYTRDHYVRFSRFCCSVIFFFVMHIIHLILELFYGASIWIQNGKNHIFIKTVSSPIILHSWLNRHYNQIWINLHFFASKVHFLRLFGAKIQKNFNKPPPKKPQIFINRRRTIGADTVGGRLRSGKSLILTRWNIPVWNIQHTP